MRQRTFLALLLMLTMLVGCAESEVEEEDFLLAGDLVQADEPAILTASAFTLPIYSGQTLDPITCSEGIQRSVSALLYEGLFTLTPSFETEYCLCDSYTYDADARLYTFHIRDGVTFGDGSALTARDVLATLNRARTSERYGARFSSVSSIRIAGSDTLRITLTQPDASFPALLDIPIVRSGTESDAVPLGTGPYLYITEGTRDYLRANSAWWRGSIQPLVRIELSSVRDEDTAAYRFSAGEVQLLRSNLLGGSSVGSTAGISVSSADTTELIYLAFQCESVADAGLRQAIRQGVDRESLVSGYLSGYAKAAWTPISPASPLYPSDLETTYQRSDFERALDALGYGEEGDAAERTLTLLVNTESSEKLAMANALASSLSYGRLTVQVKALAWEQYETALREGRFDLYLGEVRLMANWDLSALIGTSGAMNYGRYQDAVMDELMASLRAAGINAKAQARQYSSYLAQQSPLISLCFRTDAVLTHTAVLDTITPTAVDPFYHLEEWTVTLSN